MNGAHENEKGMGRRTFLTWTGISLLTAFLQPAGTAFANQAASALQVPGSAPQGSEVSIKAVFTHSADNFFHHVQWAYVKVNGKEIARWDYSSFNLPEAAQFSKEVKFTITEDCEIKAEASCNIHGSMGPAIERITLKK